MKQFCSYLMTVLRNKNVLSLAIKAEWCTVGQILINDFILVKLGQIANPIIAMYCTVVYMHVYVADNYINEPKLSHSCLLLNIFRLMNSHRTKTVLHERSYRQC